MIENKKCYVGIIPFWPLKTSVDQNYFINPMLAAQKAEFTPVLYAYSDRLIQPIQFQGITVIFFRSPFKLVKIIPQYGVIHIQAANRMMWTILTILVLQKHQRKIIWTPHTSFNLKRQPFNSMINPFYFMKFILRRVDRIVCISSYEEDYLRSLGIKNTCYLPLVISSPRISKSKRRKNSTRLLFIGGDRSIKGLKNVLEACRILSKLHINYLLNVLGEVSPEFMMKNQLLITDRIKLYGQIDPNSNKFVTVLKQSDVYLNNSYCEGAPLAGFETVMSGLNCCMPALPTLKSIFGEYALFHHPSQPSTLVQNILYFHYNPEGLRYDQGKLNQLIQATSLTTFEKNMNSLLKHLSYTS